VAVHGVVALAVVVVAHDGVVAFVVAVRGVVDRAVAAALAFVVAVHGVVAHAVVVVAHDAVTGIEVNRGVLVAAIVAHDRVAVDVGVAADNVLVAAVAPAVDLLVVAWMVVSLSSPSSN